MTKQQFNRWKDFALRMARVCYAASWRPSCAWIVDKVEQFFEGIEDDKTFIASVINWDHSAADDSDEPYPVTDLFTMEFADDVYGLDIRFGECENPAAREELAWDQYEEQWLGPVHCCVRAGLDLACEPSAGVYGFTMGHLRKMYPEGVPDWITRPEKPWVCGDVPVPDLSVVEDDVPVWL